jgi:RNA polymerase sigma-70 factor (ECF subfamily)
MPAPASLKRVAPAKPALRLIQGAPLEKPETTDQELLEALWRGDQRVAGQLYDRLVSNVEKALFSVFGRREPEHDDLVQAAFEQIVITLQRRSFAQGCSLKTWASRIACNIALNTLRKRRCERRFIDRVTRVDESMHPRAVDGENWVSARFELERLRHELTHLPFEQSQTVLLHDILGHDLAEIAVMLQASVVATQTRLSRGRRALLRRMDVPSPQGRRRRTSR